MSAEELARLHLPDKQTELIRGRLVVREPPGTEHGRLAATLCHLISDHVRRHRHGVVFGQDTGFKIESAPDTVRAPDVAFLAQDRADQIPRRGYAALAPDLLAEIVSPDDSRGDVLAKVGGWLAAGTRLVWVIYPERREAQTFRCDGSVSIIGLDGLLDGEDVLPGFSATLADVLG
ncbi:MAG TPA: Uma2 family endonuclease [Gemmatimonadaceae bacterium]|nr:Uma2 family endonuclease [Gemmatimonadaceae bacterium]